MNLRHITNFDYVLFLTVIGLSVIGILFIYSSGVNADGISVSNEYIKQLIWVVSGFFSSLKLNCTLVLVSRY